MSNSIQEIQDKKENDPWAQVREQREKFSKQAEKGGETAASSAATQLAQISGGQALQQTQQVEPKSDVAGISAEALTETRGADTGNSTERSRVNFGAWNLNEESGQGPKSSGLNEGQSVTESKESSPSQSPQKSAGEAVASEAATAIGASNLRQSGAGVGEVQPPEGVGAATAEKPLTVPGVGETKEATKTKIAEG